MTYEQFKKEFDEKFKGLFIALSLWAGSKEYIKEPEEEMKSFLKQSFIKYLQSEVERLEGEMFADPAEAGQFAMHSSGYNQALEDQITNLQAQIKELQ